MVNRKHIHFIGLLLLAGVALFLVGCFPAELVAQVEPLPTLVPEIVLVDEPVSVETAVNSIPPTFTPNGTPLPTVTPLPTLPIATLVLPSATPLAITTVVETAVSTASPFIIDGTVPQPTPRISTLYADAPFVETLPTSVPCGEHGRLMRSRFPTVFGGPRRSYHIYLPPCYGLDGRAYPVLYLFHGSIQNDSHWADLGIAPLIDYGIQHGTFAPFIVVMPDNGEIGNTTSGDTRSIEGITVNALIPFIDSNLCTWNAPEGRSIGGISRGGYWALMIAFRHTEMFTAVAGHSSHLRFETDGATYNPLATYAEADLSNMRIWMDWGETDFLRNGQRQLSQALNQIDANAEVYVNSGGHNEWYWLAHMPEYIDWYASEWPLDRMEYPSCSS